MTENKEQIYHKDSFDYDSIDGSYINNQEEQNESFILDETETARLKKFRENHAKCQWDDEGNYKFGAIGGSIVITFTKTGLGNIIVCLCNGCHKSANITNFDSF